MQTQQYLIRFNQIDYHIFECTERDPPLGLITALARNADGLPVIGLRAERARGTLRRRVDRDRTGGARRALLPQPTTERVARAHVAPCTH